MIQININNVEDLILKNPKIKSIFPELRHIIDQWLLSYRFPALDTMRKQAKLDFLNSLNGEKIEKLAKLFDDLVFVDKLDYHLVKNLNLSIDTHIENELTKNNSYSNIAISRNDNQIYITMWR